MVELKTIGLREVRGLQAGKVIWETKVPAFSVRRQKGAAVTYALFYRTKDGRERWHTIGRHGAPWTSDNAREKRGEGRRLPPKADPGE